MAASPRDLSVLAYANGFTLWLYKAPRVAQAEVAAPGYFDATADMLATGDMMMVAAADGGRIVCLVVGAEGVTLAPLV